MSSGITRDDWLTALADAGLPVENDPDAVTIAEFGSMMGLKRFAATQRLNALVESGRAIKTQRHTERADGRMFYLVAYRLTEKPKKRHGRS